MSETRLHQALRAVHHDLTRERASFALVGGLAVSARTEPRFTKDLDLAVSVASDHEAEALVGALRARGYRVQAVVEQEALGRLATVRLVPPGSGGLFVDLLFASSGIEPDIVKAATAIEVIEGLTLRVATVAHLVAVKAPRLGTAFDSNLPAPGACMRPPPSRPGPGDGLIVIASITSRRWQR